MLEYTEKQQDIIEDIILEERDDKVRVSLAEREYDSWMEDNLQVLKEDFISDWPDEFGEYCRNQYKMEED